MRLAPTIIPEYWENVHFEVVATDNGPWPCSMSPKSRTVQRHPAGYRDADRGWPGDSGQAFGNGRAHKRFPVFLITASDDDRSVTYAYDHGVMDVLSKPVNPAIVWRRVTSVIELYEKRNKF